MEGSGRPARVNRFHPSCFWGHVIWIWANRGHMLRGNSETKIDDKGRLKIPAAFKKVFEDEFPQTKFYVTSMDGKAARVYPMEEWTKIEEKLKSSFDPATADLKFKVNYYGGECDMDAQGRVLIPQV